MKIKTNELTGPVLDWAVAKCIGYKNYRFDGISGRIYSGQHFNPSTDYADGGPIIFNEKIGSTFHDERDDWEVLNWGAWMSQTDDRQEIMGETQLIACMRCYVFSVLGDEVEIPDDLA